jgi:hypothetical protein
LYSAVESNWDQPACCYCCCDQMNLTSELLGKQGQSQT